MKMRSKPMFSLLVLAAGTLLISACNASPSTATTAAAAVAAAPAKAVEAAPATKALPLVVVHKDPNCGCCGGWAEHMQAAGFPVQLNDTSDMMAVKQRLGIGDGMMSCHTSEIDGYVVEGHVPVEDIRKLLAGTENKFGQKAAAVPPGPLQNVDKPHPHHAHHTGKHKKGHH